MAELHERQDAIRALGSKAKTWITVLKGKHSGRKLSSKFHTGLEEQLP
jgi:hypothetical protein